jgi:3-oxoacyl-[acyl-carrier protein] reductase
VEIRGASALVTGAGRGIGRAIALALAREGARVTAVARTASQLQSLVREIEAGGGRAVYHAGDLRQRAVCDAAVARAVDAHGGLQVLVNNAGVGGHAPVAETTDESWDEILGTNLTAVFRLTRAALPHLSRQGGHVFMVSSLAGSNPIAGMAAYCASKAALDHFAHCLMLEVRQGGVKVTTVAPARWTPPRGAARDASWISLPRTSLGHRRLAARDGAHLSRVEMRPPGRSSVIRRGRGSLGAPSFASPTTTAPTGRRRSPTTPSFPCCPFSSS